MNVLLTITNINGFHEIPYSFGLSSIAAFAKSKGHNVEIIAIQHTDEYESYKAKIKLFKPKVVGFSTVSSQYSYVKECAEIVKKISPSIYTCVGGVHATLFPDCILESENIDVFFRGEAEVSFSDFLKCVEENQEYKDVKNLVYKKQNHVVQNTLYPIIKNLDVLPYAVKDHLFAEYIQKTKNAPFFFSRGCPYLCTYCSNHALAKTYGMRTNRPRYRSVESCIGEIKEAQKQHKFDTLWIEDDIFGLQKAWRKKFCGLYKKEIALPFVSVLRPNIVNTEFIKELKDAGCIWIMFGVESGNDYIANTVMKRNVKIEKVINAFDLCRKHNIKTTALNIIGVPGETEEMIKDTIKLNGRIKPTISAVNIFYPYKGTVLGDDCFSKDIVDLEMYNTFSSERRNTVLKFPEEYKRKLLYYRDNWETLVYPYDLYKRVRRFILRHESLHRIARILKRFLRKVVCLR